VDLTEVLREASDSPPPTSIDLDALIGGERRRERQKRWLTGTAVAAGVAVSAGVVTVGFPGTGGLPTGTANPSPRVCESLAPNWRPQSEGASPRYGDGGGSVRPTPATTPTPDTTPTAGATSPPVAVYTIGPYKPGDSPPPPWQHPNQQYDFAGATPREGCASAMRRLNQALTDALHRVAPGATLHSDDTDGRPPAWFMPLNIGRAEFMNWLTISRNGSAEADLRLRLASYATAPTPEQACGGLGGVYECHTDVLADGTVVMQEQVRYGTGCAASCTGGADDTEFAGWEVDVYRPDGTKVNGQLIFMHPDEVYSMDRPTAADERAAMARLPLTQAQLLDLVQTPGFTLFP
jgi:hypothetical protein